jgi:hypothetical protein
MAGINNFKKKNMKKIFAFLILVIAMVSCYDDYVKDFDYNAVYFPYAIDVRTFVVGEGMKIEIGADIGGVIKNTTDRNVDFALDNSLINTAALTAMQAGAPYVVSSVEGLSSISPIPANYYTLSNTSRIVIKAGQHMGSIVMKADSAAFLADANTRKAAYAIALRITGTDADRVLDSLKTTIIGLKYENMLFGIYRHGGISIQKNSSGIVIDTTRYYSSINQLNVKTWTLNTIAPNALSVKGYSGVASTKDELVLTLNGTDIAVSRATGSAFDYQPDGGSTFNRSKLLQDRKIYLKYKYVNLAGNTVFAADTLYFRNRIRDGVNEWQDANPANY